MLFHRERVAGIGQQLSLYPSQRHGIAHGVPFNHIAEHDHIYISRQQGGTVARRCALCLGKSAFGQPRTQVGIQRATTFGPLLARASHADRSRTTDNLFELEAYPRLDRNTFAYLAGGWSSRGTLYPHSRFAAEVFRTFPAR